MPDRIRVLFAIGSLEGGGSERQIINILRHLDRSQFEPHLYLIRRTGEFLNDVPDDVPITAFDDVSNPGGMYLPGRIRRALIAHFASVLTNLDIDVVYDRTPHMTLIAGPACQQLGVPHLSTIVSNPMHDLRDNIGRFRWLKFRILKRAYRCAHRVIANSESLAQACREFYHLKPEQLAVLSNGFDFDQINELASQQVNLQGRATGKFHIVAAGRLETCKGFDVLTDALDELIDVRGQTNITLSIAGRGSQEGNLKRLVDHHCLEDAVRFLGFLPNPYPLIQSADLFCLTSRYEGMPNVLVEAMSLGVPVLSTDCPEGPRDILKNGTIGTLVPHLDTVAIAAGIEQAMRPDQDRAARTVNAKESVLSRFGIGPTTSALEELLTTASQRNQ